MEDEPLWANIDVIDLIVEAHASGTGAEPPDSYAFTRCITKLLLRRTHDRVLELINNGTLARGMLWVTGRARSTRGAGGHQTLPTPWPIGTALAQAPDRSRRRPGSVLNCCTGDFLKKARR
jgi:hypothetical protein